MYTGSLKPCINYAIYCCDNQGMCPLCGDSQIRIEAHARKDARKMKAVRKKKSKNKGGDDTDSDEGDWEGSPPPGKPPPAYQGKPQGAVVGNVH